MLFSAGCNLACPFCHNPELVNQDLLDAEYCLSHNQIISELKERAGFIDAVVLTGGEPLVHEHNICLLRRIKEETSLAIKLDTNGTFPDRLKRSLPFVDFVAMDLKASPEKYIFATGGRSGFAAVKESAQTLINQSAVQYEFRSTMVPGVIDMEDVLSLLDEFAPAIINRYALQRFRSEKTLSSELTDMPPYPGGYLEELAARMTGRVADIQLRL